MKQPRINSRQARWLIYLIPYDFIIGYRLGLLNPTNGPSRQPDYMATAQKEPSLVQKDLLAQKLVEPDSCLPEAEKLCYTARPRLDKLIRLDLRPGLDKPIRSDYEPGPGRPIRSQVQLASSCQPEAKLYSTARTGLGTARALMCKTAVSEEPRLWLHEVAELGLPQALRYQGSCNYKKKEAVTTRSNSCIYKLIL